MAETDTDDRYIVKRLNGNLRDSMGLTYCIDDSQARRLVGFFYSQDIAEIAAQALNEQPRKDGQ